MRDMETPKAASRRLAERRDSPSAPRERSPSAHPLRLAAPVDSRRVMPERPTAVGASVSDVCDLILAEVYDGLVGSSALGEDLAAAALAGVGSFVGKGLDLSGDEPYYFHGRELLLGCTQLYQDFPPFPSPTVSGTVTNPEGFSQARHPKPSTNRERQIPSPFTGLQG